MRRDYHFLVFIGLIVLVLIYTNPFTLQQKGITFDLLNKYNEINNIHNIDNLTVSQRKDLAEEYLYLAKQMAKYDKYDKALLLIHKVVNLDPEYENIFNEIANIHFDRAYYESNKKKEDIIKSKDFEEAIKYGYINIERFSSSPRSYDSLINIYTLVRDYDRAIEVAKSGCKEGTGFKNLCHEVSDLYLIQGKSEEALTFYKHLALKLNHTNNAWIHKKIASIYESQDNCKEAKKHFEMAYRIHSTSDNLKALTHACYVKNY